MNSERGAGNKRGVRSEGMKRKDVGVTPTQEPDAPERGHLR